MVLLYVILSEFWFVHFMSTISLINAETGEEIMSNKELRKIPEFYIILYFLSISWILSIPVLFFGKKEIGGK